MSELRASQNGLAERRAQLTQALANSPAGDADLVQLLSALRAQHLAALPRLAKMVAKAQLPPETRLFNDATAAAILSLQQESVSFQNTLENALQLANQRVAEVALARHIAAGISVLVGTDAEYRADASNQEATERSRIAALAKVGLKKVLHRLEMQARHGAKAVEAKEEASLSPSAAAFVAEVMSVEGERNAVDPYFVALADDLEDEEEGERDDLMAAEVMAWRQQETQRDAMLEACLQAEDATGPSGLLPARVPAQELRGLMASGRTEARQRRGSGGAGDADDDSRLLWAVSALDGPRVTVVPAGRAGADDVGLSAGAVASVTAFSCVLSALCGIPAASLRVGAAPFSVGGRHKRDDNDDGAPPAAPLERSGNKKGHRGDAQPGGGAPTSGPGTPQPEKRWVGIFLAHGGYFAAGLYDVAARRFVVHKTFQRYITRRGQGGRQSAHHGRTDTAGSQLRAAMEKKWMEECRALVQDWGAKGLLDQCALLLWHAPGTCNERMLVRETVLGTNASLQQRLHHVPVNTGRPSLAECEHVLSVMLSAVVRTVCL